MRFFIRILNNGSVFIRNIETNENSVIKLKDLVKYMTPKENEENEDKKD
jgi:hypothetical protein